MKLKIIVNNFDETKKKVLNHFLAEDGGNGSERIVDVL